VNRSWQDRIALAVRAAPPLPAELIDARPDPHDAREFFAWANACRLWWVRCGVELPTAALDRLWGELIAARLRGVSDWPHAAGTNRRPEYAVMVDGIRRRFR
jgi:hypothetical protein